MADDRPKSRRPDSWPPLILRAIQIATTQEILIPFENPEKVQAFKKLLHDVRRSFREHSHPQADAVNVLRSIDYRTEDIASERSTYNVDASRYPYTVCLSPALGLAANLDAALANAHESSPSSPPVDMSREELEREITSVMREDALNDDANEVAEFFRRSRRPGRESS